MDYVKINGFSTSIVLTYNLMEMLYDNDEGEFAYQLVNSENFPGWGYMLKKGATNTWESWTGLVGATYAHPFAAFMARFFISGIAGIKPAAPGFSAIEIRPHIDGDLNWAKADIRTVQGKISSSWENQGDIFKLDVEIPGNTEAKVCIPVSSTGKAKIYESHNLIWSRDEQGQPDPNIKHLKTENEYINFNSIGKGYVDFMVGSGTYNFKVANK